jgi:hypothetical protein
MKKGFNMVLSENITALGGKRISVKLLEKFIAKNTPQLALKSNKNGYFVRNVFEDTSHWRLGSKLEDIKLDDLQSAMELLVVEEDVMIERITYLKSEQEKTGQIITRYIEKLHFNFNLEAESSYFVFLVKQIKILEKAYQAYCELGKTTALQA